MLYGDDVKSELGMAMAMVLAMAPRMMVMVDFEMDFGGMDGCDDDAGAAPSSVPMGPWPESGNDAINKKFNFDVKLLMTGSIDQIRVHQLKLYNM